MKSRFFTDTQGLDSAPPPRDKICVCLMLSRDAYDRAVQTASRLNLTSGEYIDQLLLNQRISACGTKAPQRSDNPWRRFPPAPPDH